MHRLAERLEITEHGGQQLRHSRVDVDGALHHRVGGFSVHEVEDRMNHLVTTDPEDRRAE
jgi:hypothetical protein